MATTTPTLPDVSTFDLIADMPGLLLRVKRTMIDISHVLESTAATARNCTVFAGFQRFSLVAREAGRYARLAADWRHAYVFGVPDIDLPVIPNVTAVPISPDHPLAQEWFVVADGPACGAALLSCDTSGFAIADRSRQFMGLWSADTELVRAASTRLLAALELPSPDWQIDVPSSLTYFNHMSSQLLAIQEERYLSHRLATR